MKIYSAHWQRLERLVVLVDVQVFAQGNVNASQAYAALIHSCVERVLAVCNEHNNSGHKRSTSWSYKLFDSSLTPPASCSTLQRLLKDRPEGQNHQIGRFKSAEENLGLFQETLSTVATEVNSKSDLASQSKADFIVRALQGVLSDFNWNSLFISDGSSSDEDQARRRRGECQPGGPQQNLVMVFSHLPDNGEQFASFMNMPTPQSPAGDKELFKAFSLKVKRLQEPFRLQGIRSCWIDMPRVSPSGLIGHVTRPQRPELYAVFAQTKWKFTTMDALAIASDCVPPPMLWFSVVHPDLQVQPNAHKMQCKLRINVQGRDGVTQLQPEVCRLEAVSLGSNSDSALMKESVSAILKSGLLSSKAERLVPPVKNCPSLRSPIVKIVVKSLIQKQEVSYKCSLRYLVYHHRAECEADFKKGSSMALAESRDPLADDAASDVYGHDILQQLQLEQPLSLEPGDRAWQVLLLAIARKNSVAEVDMYIDGDCSSGFLEPITLQYAALLQKCQSSKPALSLDYNKQLQVAPKVLVTSPLLQLSGDDARLEGSECARSQQEGTRPKKRPAASISVVDGPLVIKREKTECGSKQQKPAGAEVIIKHTKREGYSWIQHWRYILHRKTVGTGQVQIENRYMRPGQGKKPSKAMSIIKCWLDLVSKPKLLTAQQIVPFSPAVLGPAEPDAGEQMIEGGFGRLGSAERVGQADNAVVPLRGNGLFSASLDTEEQAESYLSSIEQMLQDCLVSDAGDLQVFVKGIMSNATRAQRILLKRKQTLDFLARPSGESMQCPIKDDDYRQVHNSAQETVKPCNSDSSCASNVSKAEKVDHNSESKPGMNGSVSRVGNGVIPDGGSSDGADSGIQTNEAILSEMVAVQLLDKLLVKPKKLARLYSNCESATSDLVHIRLEKRRAYELQILFRMELIGQDCGGPLEKEKTKILKEICKLLDDIQFDLGGGVFGGESLHDYSIRVIHNSYKERLPQTVADIFERMEFNGYVEGVSELQPAPDSTHAPADLVRSHVQKETEREELLDHKFTAMEAAAGSFVPVVLQPVEEIGQNDAFPTSSKGPSKTRRKRYVPMDAFTRASEKRKLASRLAHFGGPDSLHRLKKIKIHHQSLKPAKVSSPAMENSQPKERNNNNIVLETPWFERQINVRRAASPEVNSICTTTRVLLPSAFGFGTPAKVAKHMPTTRKRRQALFKEKKPPGRGLPRISLDLRKAMAEDVLTLHRPAKPDCPLDVDCAGESSSMHVSQSPQEQSMPDTRPEKDDIIIAENSRRTGLERRRLILDAQLETQVIQEDDCHTARVTTTQVGVYQQQVVHASNNANIPTVPLRKIRQKSKHTSRSQKQVDSRERSQPPTSAQASQVGLGSAAQESVQTVEQSDMVENSQPVDLASLENRWNDETVPCTLPFEELASKARELGSETEVLLDTQIVEEVHTPKHTNRSPGKALFEDALCLSTSDFPITTWEMPYMDLNATQDVEQEDSRVGISQMIPTSLGSRSLMPLRIKQTSKIWEMPCMDLNATQDAEQEDRVGISQMIPTSLGSRSLMPLRINQTSKICRVDPPSSLVKPPGLIVEDLSAVEDPDFSQVIKEIFQQTEMMDQAYAEDRPGPNLADAGEYSLDEYSLLLDENWSPHPPRLKPEARLCAILEEDAVAVFTEGSPIKSPSQSRKCRCPSEGSPGQYLSTPNAAVNSKRRPRSNSASPNSIKIKMLRFA